MISHFTKKLALSIGQAAIFLMVGMLHISCGQDIVLPNATNGNENENGYLTNSFAEESPDPYKYRSLTWSWPCEEKQPEQSSLEDIYLVGGGTHQLSSRRLPDELPVTFNGRICPSKRAPRDIVFIVDVSGSMIDNDHITDNDTCGRFDAIEAFLAKMNSTNEEIQFAVVTFADVIRYRSTKLYNSRDSLFADMGSPGKVLCSHESGGTRYSIAFSAAEEVLKLGREAATKEIFFISDGQPEPDYSGVLESDKLKIAGITIGSKTEKVVIGTIMLNGEDLILEKKIASRDSEGKPFHFRVNEASKLPEALERLSQSYITRAVIRFRRAGAKEWNVLDAFDNRKDGADFDFELPTFTLKKKSYINGIDAEYEYENNFQQKFIKVGYIRWEGN